MLMVSFCCIKVVSERSFRIFSLSEALLSIFGCESRRLTVCWASPQWVWRNALVAVEKKKVSYLRQKWKIRLNDIQQTAVGSFDRFNNFVGGFQVSIIEKSYHTVNAFFFILMLPTVCITKLLSNRGILTWNNKIQHCHTHIQFYTIKRFRDFTPACILKKTA